MQERKLDIIRTTTHTQHTRYLCVNGVTYPLTQVHTLTQDNFYVHERTILPISVHSLILPFSYYFFICDALADKRFVDHSQRVVNPQPASVRISDNAVTPSGVEAALDKKQKKKAYRRSDSAASGGSRSRSATKELALPPDDSLMCPPSFVTGLKPELEVRDGTFLELRVQVKGDPDPQVTWTKDGAALSSSEILEVKCKNGAASVTIKEVFPEDAGKYSCKATNTKGSVETSCKLAILPMIKGSKSSAANGGGAMANGGAASRMAPRIHTHAASQVAKDGDPVRLECTIAGGDTRFDVVWLHNEKEIKPSKDFQYTSAGNKHTLEIHEIFPEDAGTYTCEAFNDVGECFSTCSLVVEVPGEDMPGPAFKNYPRSLTVDKKGSASFACELDRTPKSVTWMKDGKELKELPMKMKLTTNKARLGLDVMECGVSDAGVYAVIVTDDKGGENKAAFSLNVNV